MLIDFFKMKSKSTSPKSFFDLTSCNGALAFAYAIPIGFKAGDSIKDQGILVESLCRWGFVMLVWALMYIVLMLISLIMRKAYQVTAKGLKIDCDNAVADEMIACGVCAAIAYKVSMFIPETLNIGDAFVIRAWFLAVIVSFIIFIIQIAIVCKKQNATIFQSLFLVLIPTFTPILIYIGVMAGIGILTTKS